MRTSHDFLAATLAVVGLMTGCDAILGKELNPKYCEAHPQDSDCKKAFPDAPVGPMTCGSDQQCSGDPSTPVCDLAGSKMCVQCTPAEASACATTMPVCGDDNACRACAAHAECTTSQACLPDGSCGSDTNVAYVDPTGTATTMCTKAMPCGKLSDALKTAKPYIKLTGTTDEAVSINNQNVTLLADTGAQLTSTQNGLLLEVKGTSHVAIYDLEITGASGSGGFGISLPAGNTATLELHRAKVTNNNAGGISTTGGILNIAQSTISNNPGGGININNSQYDVSNSFIVDNGGSSSVLGGVKVDGITTAGMHQFLFNTVSANIGPATVNTGVTCGTVLVPVSFSDSIIYLNIVSGGGVQIGGSANCTASYSDIGPDAFAGTGNINQDPKFVNSAGFDYHIQPGSPAENVADPAATLSVDFDGDTRPQGGRSDMGADEVKQ